MTRPIALGDVLPSSKGDILDDLIREELPAELRKAMLRVLNPQQRWVLAQRWLNGEDKPPTLRALALELGLSKGRVHQIEVQALEKLANSFRVLALLPQNYPKKRPQKDPSFRARREGMFR